MNPPKAQSKNKLLKERQATAEKKRREANAKVAKKAADVLFPGETWNLKDDIYISSRRGIGANSNFTEELRDAKILKELGSTVYLVTEKAYIKGKKYDAIVNGLEMEFKNVRGNANTLETQFLRSRSQAPNVFINLEESNLNKQQIISALYGARNKPAGIDKNGKRIKGYADYNQFSGGRIIVKIKGQKNLLYLNVDDLKVKKA